MLRAVAALVTLNRGFDLMATLPTRSSGLYLEIKTIATILLCRHTNQLTSVALSEVLNKCFREALCA